MMSQMCFCSLPLVSGMVDQCETRKLLGSASILRSGTKNVDIRVGCSMIDDEASGIHNMILKCPGARSPRQLRTGVIHGNLGHG
jgi:hypothetical protein